MKLIEYLNNKKILDLDNPNFQRMLKSSNLLEDTLGVNYDTLSIAIIEGETLTKKLWHHLIEHSDHNRVHARGNNLMLMLGTKLPYIDKMLSYADFTVQNCEGLNALMLVYHKNIVLTNGQMKKILAGTDLEQVDTKGNGLLYYMLKSDLPKNKEWLEKIPRIYNNELYLQLLRHTDILQLTPEYITDIISKCNPKYQNHLGINLLMTCLRHNSKLNLASEQFNKIIISSDLKQKSIERFDALLYVFCYHSRQKLYFTPEILDYFIYNSDLKNVNNEGWDALMIAFSNNAHEKLNLNIKQYDKLIADSDLKSFNKYGYNAITFAFRYNAKNELKLTSHQLEQLIDGSNLTHNVDKGWDALMYAFSNHESQKLNLSVSQIEKIIKKGNFKNSASGFNALYFALREKKNCLSFNLTSEHIDYMVSKSNLSNKNLLDYDAYYSEDILIKIIKGGALKKCDQDTHKRILSKGTRVGKWLAKNGNTAFYASLLPLVTCKANFNLMFDLAEKDSSNIINFFILPHLSKSQAESLLEYPLTSYNDTATCLTMCLSLGIDISRAIVDGFSTQELTDKNLSLLTEAQLDKIYPYVETSIINQSPYLQTIYLSQLNMSDRKSRVCKL